MPHDVNLKRRSFLRGAIQQQHLPRLPWAIADQDFLNGCSQCNKCLDSCETQIIKRDKQGYPFVDFDQDECTFCQKCSDVCPENLFVEAKQTTPWHGEFTISEKCLAKNNIYCQSCRDVCDENAITFQHNGHAIAKPNLTIKDCSQCGACVSVCPQDAIAFQLAELSQDKGKTSL
mgnify:CR=1 FL=1